jgi:hypothetical protein
MHQKLAVSATTGQDEAAERYLSENVTFTTVVMSLSMLVTSFMP